MSKKKMVFQKYLFIRYATTLSHCRTQWGEKLYVINNGILIQLRFTKKFRNLYTKIDSLKQFS